jgi:hypothetical protein
MAKYLYEKHGADAEALVAGESLVELGAGVGVSTSGILDGGGVL